MLGQRASLQEAYVIWRGTQFSEIEISELQVALSQDFSGSRIDYVEIISAQVGRDLTFDSLLAISVFFCVGVFWAWFSLGWRAVRAFVFSEMVGCTLFLGLYAAAGMQLNLITTVQFLLLTVLILAAILLAFGPLPPSAIEK